MGEETVQVTVCLGHESPKPSAREESFKDEVSGVGDHLTWALSCSGGVLVLDGGQVTAN